MLMKAVLNEILVSAKLYVSRVMRSMLNKIFPRFSRVCQLKSPHLFSLIHSIIFWSTVSNSQAKLYIVMCVSCLIYANPLNCLSIELKIMPGVMYFFSNYLFMLLPKQTVSTLKNHLPKIHVLKLRNKKQSAIFSHFPQNKCFLHDH